MGRKDEGALSSSQLWERWWSGRAGQSPLERRSPQPQPAPSRAPALSQLLEVGQDTILSLLGPRVCPELIKPIAGA